MKLSKTQISSPDYCCSTHPVSIAEFFNARFIIIIIINLVVDFTPFDRTLKDTVLVNEGTAPGSIQVLRWTGCVVKVSPQQLYPRNSPGTYIVIIFIFITFIQDIYNYTPKTNHVSTVYSVAALRTHSFIYMLLRMLHVLRTCQLALSAVRVQRTV